MENENRQNKVYAVIESYTRSFSNDLCWDDGYYDDYYETEVTSESIVGVYSSKELAERACQLNREKDSSLLFEFYYVEYDVLDSLDGEQ